MITESSFSKYHVTCDHLCCDALTRLELQEGKKKDNHHALSIMP